MRNRDRIRTGIITVLLGSSLVFVGLLSVQTFDAVASHERLAEDVVRDYTALAADEFDRRTSLVAYRGFYPVMVRLSQVPIDEDLPSPESLPGVIETDDVTLRRAAGLARSFFRYDPRVMELTQTGASIPAAAADRLRQDISGFDLTDPPENLVRTFHVEHQGEHLNFVYGPVQDRFLVGIWVDNEEVLAWIDYLYTNFPLVPTALTDGNFGNDSVYLKVWSKGGDVVFQRGDVSDNALLVNRPVGSELAELYGGLRLAVGIDPTVAGNLVIGGLPQSRLPLLAGLWALIVVTIVVAMVLLRRERALIRLRSDFISRVSHELRTPLTQILMFAQTLLLDRVRSDDERRRSLQVIDKEARRLSHLVENILQFSRGERGAVELKLTQQPLFPLVREITDQFRPLLKEGRRLVVSSEINDEVEVALDVQAFQQMVVNLLDNAVKYSPAGESVDVTVSANDDQVSVAVEDHGPGIPVAERERIWEPYYRTLDQRNAAVGGNGIGLAVVRELARLHHANIEVSDRDGGGSRFTIDFERPANAA